MRPAASPISAGLARETPTAANIRAYADIVRERSLLRHLIRVSGEIAASAYDSEGRPAKDLVDDAERRVFQIAEAGRRTGSGFVPLRDILGATIDRLDMLHQSPGAAHRRGHRLQRPRPHDGRPAARRPRHRRGPALDGQDDAGAQHRRERRHRRQHAGRGVLDGNVARAALDAHDFLARSRGPEPPAHGHVRRRGLGAHQQRHRADEGRTDLHRRQRGADADGSAGEGAAAVSASAASGSSSSTTCS